VRELNQNVIILILYFTNKGKQSNVKCLMQHKKVLHNVGKYLHPTNQLNYMLIKTPSSSFILEQTAEG